MRGQTSFWFVNGAARVNGVSLSMHNPGFRGQFIISWACL